MQYRNELKFALSSQTAELIKRRISGIMSPDKHTGGVYIVRNIYLDDQYDSFYNEKHAGSYNRDKYRVRYYNDDLSYICFENKHKDGTLAYKDKVVMSEDEYNAIRSGDFSFAAYSEHPLWQKVFAIHNSRTLRPAAAFSYTREAYVYELGDVRITFDSVIRPDSMTPMANFTSPLGINPLMEVKYTGFMPTVIAGMLHGLPLVRTELSKYCYIRENTWQKPGQSVMFAK